MVDLRAISDDFFTIVNIAVLQRNTGNSTYDFDFRNNFSCKSVVSEVDVPVLLHIGAIEDYEGIEAALAKLGMKLLVREEEHIRCSTIERWCWYLEGKTPFTKIYDELPDIETLRKDFSFPIFVKGNRQTNRHKRSQCIIENPEQYEMLREVWKYDPVLSWQRAAVREYVPLQVIDDATFPDMVPICYEFRFFYYAGDCMAYGPYWNIGQPYSLPDEELPEVLKLTDWAAERLCVPFLAIDVAKTAAGEWIIIEVNDAQESGFAGVNPVILWNHTIQVMQMGKCFAPGRARKEEKVFEFSMYDAWFHLIKRVTVLREGIVRYYVDSAARHWTISPEFAAIEESFPTATIRNKGIGLVKEIVYDDRLYSFDSYDLSEELERTGIAAEDGYEYEFFFCDGERRNKLSQYHLNYCIGSPKKFPCVSILAEALDRMALILVPRGVDKRCFTFDYPKG